MRFPPSTGAIGYPTRLHDKTLCRGQKDFIFLLFMVIYFPCNTYIKFRVHLEYLN